ncbi:MAG: hypothetical protein PHC41_09180 [Lachnospiraceae bacterium]|nr:hypothetical protein [Lachnospiraceae bacterium]MDD3616382.1 hypothetical protein [Lachnospiraceae bacterium]
MNEDTRHLLQECISGCKMAITSMDQVIEMSPEQEIRQVIDCYKEKHEEIESRISKLLEEIASSEKEPRKVAEIFSWFTTEMKLLMRNDDHQAAKLMMDGCNMGIQSVSEYYNKYTEASKEVKDIALELIHMEEEFVKELKKFL